MTTETETDQISPGPTTARPAVELACEFFWRPPAAFRNVNWDYFPSSIRAAVNESIGSLYGYTPRGLLIMGPVGTGKTSLIWLIVLERIREYFSQCEARLEQLRANYGEGWLDDLYEETRRRLITVIKHGDVVRELREHRIADCAETFPEILRRRLICIDDLGVGHDDQVGWNLSLQEEWFDWRWENRLPLIITTNKGRSGEHGLRSWPGWARIVDRIADPEYMIAISLPGKSKRVKR
jgi:DNA replication protein DnaC